MPPDRRRRSPLTGAVAGQVADGAAGDRRPGAPLSSRDASANAYSAANSSQPPLPRAHRTPEPRRDKSHRSRSLLALAERSSRRPRVPFQPATRDKLGDAVQTAGTTLLVSRPAGAEA